MKTIVAKLQKPKLQELEIPPSVTITRLKVVPMFVHGRIELHYVGLPDGAKVSHSLKPS